MALIPRKTYPELTALTAPVVDGDVLAAYRSPGPLRRLTASTFADYIKAFFSASGGSALVGFLQAGTSAVSRTLQSKNRETVSITDFGAVPDGGGLTVNSRAAIQAAIDYANTKWAASGSSGLVTDILVPPDDRFFYIGSSPIILKSGAVLRLQGSIKGDGAAVIDTPVGDQLHCGIIGPGRIFGGGTADPGIGVRLRSVRFSRFAEFEVNNCADQGFLYEAGYASKIDQLFLVNCLLDQTRAADAGVFEVNGTDHYIYNIEAAGQDDTISAGSYCGAMLISGTNNVVVGCIGEFGDWGIKVTGANNKFTACRADNTLGHGIIDAGSANSWSACQTVNIGTAAASTYDHLTVTATTHISSDWAFDAQTTAGRYAINATGTSNNYDVQISSYIATGTFTKEVNVANSQGASVLGGGRYEQASGATIALPNTRFSVSLLSYGSPTNLTAVSGGIPGKLYVFYINTNVTIVPDGFNIITVGNTNINSAEGAVLFMCIAPGRIIEVGR